MAVLARLKTDYVCAQSTLRAVNEIDCGFLTTHSTTTVIQCHETVVRCTSFGRPVPSWIVIRIQDQHQSICMADKKDSRCKVGDVTRFSKIKEIVSNW